jgi:SAM-dependent methyltransferase
VTLHPAARGFDTTADAYERARPTYPPDAVAALAEALAIGPGRTVVDLAAGTGKLTRLLVPTGARLIAVEPLEAMRSRLAAVVPEAEVYDGTAEAIALPDRSADAAVVAQAFHWFDGPRALAEIARVLRPDARGGLGLLWNVRDLTVDWVHRLAEITEPHATDVPRHRTGAWREAFETTARFTPLEHRQFAFEHEVDADTMVDRIRSISWISVLPEQERDDVLGRVRRLFEGMPARFPVPYHTELWWCRLR